MKRLLELSKEWFGRELGRHLDEGEENERKDCQPTKKEDSLKKEFAENQEAEASERIIMQRHKEE